MSGLGYIVGAIALTTLTYLWAQSRGGGVYAIFGVAAIWGVVRVIRGLWFFFLPQSVVDPVTATADETPVDYSTAGVGGFVGLFLGGLVTVLLFNVIWPRLGIGNPNPAVMAGGFLLFLVIGTVAGAVFALQRALARR